MLSSNANQALRPIKAIWNYVACLWSDTPPAVIRYETRSTLGFSFKATVHEATSGYVLRVQYDRAKLSAETEVSKVFCTQVLTLFKNVDRHLNDRTMPDRGFRDPMSISLFSSLPETQFSICQIRYPETLTTECYEEMKKIELKFKEAVKS